MMDFHEHKHLKSCCLRICPLCAKDIYVLCLFLKANLGWDTFERNIIIKPHIQTEEPHLGIYLTSLTAVR